MLEKRLITQTTSNEHQTTKNMRILQNGAIGLIVDIQERLYPHIAENEVFLANTIKLIQGLKILNVPIIVTEQYRKGIGPTLPQIQQQFDNFEYIEKMAFSCCDEPEFKIQLDQAEKISVIIAGMESHICVLQTCLDLLAEGYQPIVIEDCVSSRNLNDKATAIMRMQQEGVIISSTESILFELTRVSGTETFKAISKLVK
jgi:nicotinamidase-related amidase